MADGGNTGAFKILLRFCECISGVDVGFGAIVLTGWFLHLQRLKGFIPGQVSVKANTAVCFILIGVALWLVISGARKGFAPVLSRVLPLLASVVGLLSLLECWKGWDLGIDQLLFKAAADDLPGSVRIALMSPITAADFFLLGISIAVLEIEALWARVLRNLLATTAAVVSMVGVLDFVLDPHNTHTHIAPLTAAILFLTAFAVLCARAQEGLGALLTSSTVGGLLCRRLLPSAILIPVGIAWLRWKGQQIWLYSEWTGLAIMTVSAASLLAGLTIWTAFVADRADADKSTAEASVRRLAAIVMSSNDGIIGKTLDGTVTSWNPGAEFIYGYSAEEIIGQPITRVIPPDLHGEFENFLLRLRTGESIRNYETQRARKDGKRITVSITVSPLRDGKGNIVGAATITRDITEGKQNEEKARRLNRTLRALSECTERLMRATEEAAVLQEVCDVVTEVAGYRMAWVGYAEKDESKTVRPMAAAGFDEGYLAKANVVWAEVPRGRGPTGTCIRSGQTSICQDVLSDTRLEPWREQAIQQGFRSSMAVPLKLGTDVIGALTIYASEPGRFESEEQKLLEQLASNMTYAIMTLRARVEKSTAETALNQSELRYRSLVTATAQIVWTTNADGEVVHDMPLWREYTGLGLEQTMGSGWLISLHPDDRERVARIWAKAWRARSLYDTEYRIRRRDGEYRMFAVRGVPIREADGRIREWIGTCTDITDRKRAEEEVRRASVYNRNLIEASLDPLVTIRNDGKILDVNRATEIVTGVPRSDLVGSDFCDYFTEPEKARRGYERVFAEGSVRDYPLAIRDSSGNLMEVLYNASLFTDEAGHVQGVFAAARDVTRMKAAEQEVRRLNEELEQRVIQRTTQLQAANKELEAFTYSVSHDLRAPLRHISGFSKILSEEFAAVLPCEAQHHVQRILEGTRRMGQLVDDLLNLGRVGRKELSLQVSGLRSIVDEVIEGLKPDIGDRQVDWRISDLPYVEVDTALMQQVLQNLLSNALKFSRPRSRAVIEIGQERRDGTRVVYVRDNGVGFSMKYADKLFGVFQRLHRQEDFEGTGVGLATVQRIIQKHGGLIWAEAELDKGATFYFTLGDSQSSEENSQAVASGGGS